MRSLSAPGSFPYDCSGSVEVNFAKFGGNPRLLLVQADILAVPCADDRFDKVFYFGVLQHTPDPRGALESLIRKLRPGGEIVTDIYPPPHPCRGLLQSKYLARRFTQGMAPELLHRLVSGYVDGMWPLARLLLRGPHGVQALRRPLIDDPRLRPGMDPSRWRKFAKLNLFDMVPPAYNLLADVAEFRVWHGAAGLQKIEVGPGYNGVEGRGVKRA